MGIHSTFSENAADEICDRMAEGETLRAICRDPHMPAWRTVYDWKSAHPEFAARFAQAREVGYDAIAEEALDIANTPVIGERRETSDDGLKVTREDMLGHRKLQIETRLKLLAKWSPKKYGESSKLELAGSLAVHDMSEAEILAELATLGAIGALAGPEDVSDLV